MENDSAGRKGRCLDSALEQIIASLRSINSENIPEPERQSTSRGRPPGQAEFADSITAEDADRAFAVLCEHIILTGRGERIVKAPAKTLEIRSNFLFHEAAAVLEELVRRGLIKGSPPWQIIQIIPDAPVPQFRAGGAACKRGRPREIRSDASDASESASLASRGFAPLPQADPAPKPKSNIHGRYFPKSGSGEPPRRRVSYGRRHLFLTHREVYNVLRERASAISGKRIVRGAALVLERHFKIRPWLAVGILEALSKKGYLENCGNWRAVSLCADIVNDDSYVSGA